MSKVRIRKKKSFNFLVFNSEEFTYYKRQPSSRKDLQYIRMKKKEQQTTMHVFLLLLVIATTKLTDAQDTGVDQVFSFLNIYNNSIVFRELMMNPTKYFQLESLYSCTGGLSSLQNQLNPGSGAYHSRVCSCQPSCEFYGTCCIDYFWQAKTKWQGSKEYLDFLRRKKFNITSCQPIVKKTRQNDNHETKVQHIRMVSACLENTGTTSNITLPVIGIDLKIYKNPDIALCHQISEYNLLPVEVSCALSNSSSQANLEIQNGDCEYRVSVPDHLKSYVHTCWPENTCAGINSTYASLCEVYSGRILMKNINYNNIHCTMCGQLKKPYDITVGTMLQPRDIFRPMPYSVIFSYGETTENVIYEKDGKKIRKFRCKQHEIYDLEAKICIPFLCPVGYVQNGFSCMKADGNSNDERKSGIKILDDIPTRIHKCLFSNYHKSILLLKLPKEINYLPNQPIKSYKFPYNVYNITINNKQQIIQRFRDQLQKGNAELHIISTTVKNTKMYGLGMFHSFPSHKVCYKPKVYRLNITATPSIKGLKEKAPKVDGIFELDINTTEPKQDLPTMTAITINDVTLDSHCQLTINGSLYAPENYTFTMDLSYGNYSDEVTISVCDEYHLHSVCPLKIIQLEDYTVTHGGDVIIKQDNQKGNKTDDERLEHLEQNETIRYNYIQYVPENEGIAVCLNHYNSESSKRNSKTSWRQTARNVEGYISLVGCFISILFYTLLITIYLQTKELREIPGRNIICITISLLLSDVIMVFVSFAERNTRLCFVITVLLYFTMLSAQTWSTVVSFEIWFTLRKHTPAKFIFSPRRFYWYCCYGFLIPFAITLTISILDVKKVLDINYDQLEEYCWISNQKLRLYLYLLPVVVAFVYNIIVLSITLFRIYNHEKKSAKLLKKSSDSERVKIAKMAIKLVLLLGIVEIIGLVQIPDAETDTDVIFNFVFRYFVTVMRAIRGFFMWVLFVYMDKKAWKRQKWWCHAKKSYLPKDTPTIMTKSSVKSYKATNSNLNI